MISTHQTCQSRMAGSPRTRVGLARAEPTVTPFILDRPAITMAAGANGTLFPPSLSFLQRLRLRLREQLLAEIAALASPDAARQLGASWFISQKHSDRS